MTDRFSLPDESAVIRSHADEGIKGDWDKIYHPEESDSLDASQNKKRVRGGGVGSEDLFQENQQNLNPEHLHLKEEYRKAQENGETRVFNDWLNSDDAVISRQGEPVAKPPTKAKEHLEVDKVGFHLGINRQNLNRKADGRDKGAVEDFWGSWAKVGNSDKSDVDAIGFGVDGKKISSIIMKLKDGSSITIPAHIFRSVFDGVKPYHDKFTGDVTGFEFKNLSGERGYIHPLTPQDKLEGVMKKMHMNGQALPNDVRFFIGPFESPIPIDMSQLFKVRQEV